MFRSEGTPRLRSEFWIGVTPHGSPRPQSLCIRCQRPPPTGSECCRQRYGLTEICVDKNRHRIAPPFRHHFGSSGVLIKVPIRTFLEHEAFLKLVRRVGEPVAVSCDSLQPTMFRAFHERHVGLGHSSGGKVQGGFDEGTGAPVGGQLRRLPLRLLLETTVVGQVAGACDEVSSFAAGPDGRRRRRGG